MMSENVKNGNQWPLRQNVEIEEGRRAGEEEDRRRDYRLQQQYQRREEDSPWNEERRGQNRRWTEEGRGEDRIWKEERRTEDRRWQDKGRGEDKRWQEEGRGENRRWTKEERGKDRILKEERRSEYRPRQEEKKGKDKRWQDEGRRVDTPWKEVRRGEDRQWFEEGRGEDIENKGENRSWNGKRGNNDQEARGRVDAHQNRSWDDREVPYGEGRRTENVIREQLDKQRGYQQTRNQIRHRAQEKEKDYEYDEINESRARTRLADEFKNRHQERKGRRPNKVQNRGEHEEHRYGDCTEEIEQIPSKEYNHRVNEDSSSYSKTSQHTYNTNRPQDTTFRQYPRKIKNSEAGYRDYEYYEDYSGNDLYDTTDINKAINENKNKIEDTLMHHHVEDISSNSVSNDRNFNTDNSFAFDRERIQNPERSFNKDITRIRESLQKSKSTSAPEVSKNHHEEPLDVSIYTTGELGGMNQWIKEAGGVDWLNKGSKSYQPRPEQLGF